MAEQQEQRAMQTVHEATQAQREAELKAEEAESKLDALAEVQAETEAKLAQMGAVEAEDEHADADFQPGAQRQCRIIDARRSLIASLRTARCRVRGGGGVRRGPDRRR